MLKFLPKVIVENSLGAIMLAYYQVCYYCVNANCSAHSLSRVQTCYYFILKCKTKLEVEALSSFKHCVKGLELKFPLPGQQILVFAFLSVNIKLTHK